MSENENQYVANARTEAEESWKNIGAEERTKIKEEYQKVGFRIFNYISEST